MSEVTEAEHGRERAEPYFSICVPQYNRTEFLIEALRALSRQTFTDFEICVADDCSTDDKQVELLKALDDTGRPYIYRRQAKNRRYDGNLRTAIDMSRGRYCFLLGNDDRPTTDDELAYLHAQMEAVGEVGVAISNFRELTTGNSVIRMPTTGVIGTGPDVAATNFRNFSFVSGVVLHGEQARALTTDRWDGSEMYQMYIGSRIIASGKPLLSLSRVAIEKDIQIRGLSVDSYGRKPRLDPCPIVERQHTFHLLAPLVMDAIAPYAPPERHAELMERVARQVLLFTYPFWIFEHRRVQSWNYAAGICLGMRPKNILAGHKMSAIRRARLTALYAATTTAGMTVPIGLFDAARPALYRLAKASLTRLTRSPLEASS